MRSKGVFCSYVDLEEVFFQLHCLVALFGSWARSLWWYSQKTHHWWETFSAQVPWGKDEKNFGERVK